MAPKQLNPEEREELIQKILRDYPSVTREKLDEMMSLGRPMTEEEDYYSLVYGDE